MRNHLSRVFTCVVYKSGIAIFNNSIYSELEKRLGHQNFPLTSDTLNSRSMLGAVYARSGRYQIY